MFLQHLKHCNSRLQEIEASLDDVPMCIQDAKFVSQLLSERASSNDHFWKWITWIKWIMIHFLLLLHSKHYFAAAATRDKCKS